MLVNLILSVISTLVVPNVMSDELVVPGLSTIVPPKIFAPVSLNYNTDNNANHNKLPIQFQVDKNLENSKVSDCLNSTVLLSILNMMTKFIPQDDRNVSDPEKFKYVLTTIRNFLETTPFNSENLELHNRLKNLEEQLIELNDPSLREAVDKTLKTKISLQFQLPTLHDHNCHQMFSNLVNFIYSTYSQVVKYCAKTAQSNTNRESMPNVNNEIYSFNPNAPIQQNFTDNVLPIQGLTTESKYYLAPDNKLNEPTLPSNNLIDFVKKQKGKGIHNIMTVLQNYRPSAVPTIASSGTNPNEIKYPQLYPGNTLTYQPTPSLSPPTNKPLVDVNGQNPNLQLYLSNIYKTPNLNPTYWQSISSKVIGLPGNSYENPQKFLENNRLDVTNSIYPGMENITFVFVNDQFVPIKIESPITNENADMSALKHPNFISSEIKDTNVLNNLLKLYPNIPPQKLLNTNINLSGKPITQTRSDHALNKILVDSSSSLLNMLQNSNKPNPILQNNLQMTQPDTPKNILQPISSPQSTYNFITYEQNSGRYPFGWNDKIHKENSNVLDVNQIPPTSTLSDYNANFNRYNAVDTFSGNEKPGNYGDQLLDINRLLGVANLAKLNSIANKNSVVELTYMLKRPKSIYESEYFVKYQLPYQTLLYNMQSLLKKKPQLRTEPKQLYQELLVGSNVTDTSKDLKVLNYEDILKLTSTNGTLITAKILESNDAVIDQKLKLIQMLNSKLPLENIINLNASKNVNLESKESSINETKNVTPTVNTLQDNIYPTIFNMQRRGLYPTVNYPFNILGQYTSSLNYNPYSLYQSKPMAYGNQLKYGYNVPVTNTLKVPALYYQNLVGNYPRILGR